MFTIVLNVQCFWGLCGFPTQLFTPLSDMSSRTYMIHRLQTNPSIHDDTRQIFGLHFKLCRYTVLKWHFKKRKKNVLILSHNINIIWQGLEPMRAGPVATALCSAGQEAWLLSRCFSTRFIGSRVFFLGTYAWPVNINPPPPWGEGVGIHI